MPTHGLPDAVPEPAGEDPAHEQFSPTPAEDPAPEQFRRAAETAREQFSPTPAEEPAPEQFRRAAETAREHFPPTPAEDPAQDWRGLGDLSRRQEARFSTAQLRRLGFNRQALTGFVAEGRLRREFRGVYRDLLAPDAPRGPLWAAQLALGPTGFFSHRTAAALLGLRPVNPYAIEVTVIRGHTPRRPPLIVRRCSFQPLRAELRTTGGLRHSSATRMLFEEADRETGQELHQLIDRCAQRNLLHLDQINGLAARHPHLPGARQLIAALRYYQPTPEDVSRFERDFAQWVNPWIGTLAGVPQPLRNQSVGPWEMDFFWPGQRVVVETDGDPYHRTLKQRERDRRKDAWCQVNGYRILRVTELRFALERPQLQADLTALLLRGPDGSAPART